MSQTMSPRRGFPAPFKRLSPIGRASWLLSDACKALVAAGRLQQSQVEAERRRLQKATREVARIVPSPCRLSEFEHGHPFPPRAETTPMVRAAVTFTREEREVYWPPQHVIDDATYDVHVWHDVQRQSRLEERGARVGGTESPSARAIEQLADAGLAVVQVKLEPEDDRALRAYVERFKARAEIRV